MHVHAPSPIGDLLLLAVDSGLTELRFSEGDPPVEPAEAMNPGEQPPVLADAREQLDAYFAGERLAFDLALALEGSPFFVRVWQAVSAIPFGETRTYGDIAAEVGAPRAARAVGLANGRNPLPIIVPCHRLVGADGNLTGYGGGLERKRWLLEHETNVITTLGSAA
jgi:methylated-DNA-[protein]-cysteine S-methyltransferase